MTGLLNIFEISMETHLVSSLFLNERNIATSLLIKDSKCAVVHYAKLNSSSINKAYLKAVEYAILSFSISYFCQKLYEKKYYFISRCSILVILNGKVWKKCFFYIVPK